MRDNSKLVNRNSIVALIALTGTLVLSACAARSNVEGVDIESVESTASGPVETPMPTSTALLEDVISERTPVPTLISGPIEQNLENLVENSELANVNFLGLEISDWLSLLIAVIFIFIGYLIGTLVVKRGLIIFAQQAPEGLDQGQLKKLSSDIRWLVVVVIATIAIRRIGFIDTEIRTLLVDLDFILGTILAFRISSKSISLAEDWYRIRSVEDGSEEDLSPVITLLVRMARGIAAIIIFTAFLAHFGSNVSALAAVIGIVGLALTLAARDTIADAISGFILLVERPFRIGDRIMIQGLETRGDVVDIGLRTTRIRKRDNTMVVVPNSMLSGNQVINYSFPDPRFRVETHIGIAYGTDIEKMRNLIKDTISNLDFVLSEKPVDVLYNEMGDSAMIFLVRWWIESYTDHRRATDRVHTILQAALDEAGIESPFPTQIINMKVEPKIAENLSQRPKDAQE